MQDEPFQEVYFIGIELPNDISKAVAALSTELYALDKAMLKPIVLHITLLHPPSLQGIMPSEMLPRVQHVATRYLPLTIALQDIGFFGDDVAYISAQSHSLDSLQYQLVKLLPPSVQESQYRHAFLPHVTIAQIHKPNVLNKDAITAICSNSLKLPIQFTVTSVTCFHRILPRKYTTEKL